MLFIVALWLVAAASGASVGDDLYRHGIRSRASADGGSLSPDVEVGTGPEPPVFTHDVLRRLEASEARHEAAEARVAELERRLTASERGDRTATRLRKASLERSTHTKKPHFIVKAAKGVKSAVSSTIQTGSTFLDAAAIISNKITNTVTLTVAGMVESQRVSAALVIGKANEAVRQLIDAVHKLRKDNSIVKLLQGFRETLAGVQVSLKCVFKNAAKAPEEADAPYVGPVSGILLGMVPSIRMVQDFARVGLAQAEGATTTIAGLEEQLRSADTSMGDTMAWFAGQYPDLIAKAKHPVSPMLVSAKQQIRTYDELTNQVRENAEAQVLRWHRLVKGAGTQIALRLDEIWRNCYKGFGRPWTTTQPACHNDSEFLQGLLHVKETELFELSSRLTESLTDAKLADSPEYSRVEPLHHLGSKMKGEKAVQESKVGEQSYKVPLQMALDFFTKTMTHLVNSKEQRAFTTHHSEKSQKSQKAKKEVVEEEDWKTASWGTDWVGKKSAGGPEGEEDKYGPFDDAPPAVQGITRTYVAPSTSLVEAQQRNKLAVALHARLLGTIPPGLLNLLTTLETVLSTEAVRKRTKQSEIVVAQIQAAMPKQLPEEMKKLLASAGVNDPIHDLLIEPSLLQLETQRTHVANRVSTPLSWGHAGGTPRSNSAPGGALNKAAVLLAPPPRDAWQGSPLETERTNSILGLLGQAKEMVIPDFVKTLPPKVYSALEGTNHFLKGLPKQLESIGHETLPNLVALFRQQLLEEDAAPDIIRQVVRGWTAHNIKASDGGAWIVTDGWANATLMAAQVESITAGQLPIRATFDNKRQVISTAEENGEKVRIDLKKWFELHGEEVGISIPKEDTNHYHVTRTSHEEDEEEIDVTTRAHTLIDELVRLCVAAGHEAETSATKSLEDSCNAPGEYEGMGYIEMVIKMAQQAAIVEKMMLDIDLTSHVDSMIKAANAASEEGGSIHAAECALEEVSTMLEDQARMVSSPQAACTQIVEQMYSDQFSEEAIVKSLKMYEKDVLLASANFSEVVRFEGYSKENPAFREHNIDADGELPEKYRDFGVGFWPVNGFISSVCKYTKNKVLIDQIAGDQGAPTPDVVDNLYNRQPEHVERCMRPKLTGPRRMQDRRTARQCCKVDTWTLSAANEWVKSSAFVPFSTPHNTHHDSTVKTLATKTAWPTLEFDESSFFKDCSASNPVEPLHQFTATPPKETCMIRKADDMFTNIDDQLLNAGDDQSFYRQSEKLSYRRSGGVD